jgi:hypothetical protein
MNATGLQLVMVSRGAPSVFASAVAEPFRRRLAGVQLGETPQEWYQRAKTAIAKYENLIARTGRIANQGEKQKITSWVGSPGDEATPAYRYSRVLDDLRGDVESVSPPNIQAYSVERRQERIKKLEDFNREFESMVATAESVFGMVTASAPSAPAPAGTPPEAPASPWVLPVIVGGGAVAITALLLLLRRGD